MEAKDPAIFEVAMLLNELLNKIERRLEEKFI
jgi:hypothetical protein